MKTKWNGALWGAALVILALVGVAAAVVADIQRGDDERPFVLYAETAAMQTYVCTAEGMWPETSVPLATLVDENDILVGLHSAGPTGPRWEAENGWVVGRKVKAYSVAGAIPELDLEVIERGGQGPVAAAKTIRRRKTEGGLHPAGPCTPGDSRSVPYRARYEFVR